MILNSIRWRIQLWHGIILTAVVVGFGITAYHLESNQRFRLIDEELQKRNSLLTSFIPPGASPSRPTGDRRPPDRGRDSGPRDRPPGPDPRVSAKVATLFEGQSPRDYYYILWHSDGRVQAQSANAPTNTSIPEARVDSEWQRIRTQNGRRELVRYTPADRTILTGRSISDDLAALDRLRWWLFAAGGGVLLIGLAGGAWLAQRAIQPIQSISATAAQIADGDLSRRINVADTDNELGWLAQVLNATFARLEAAFAQQARFTADAAHELRTPISVLLTHTQNGLSDPCNCPDHAEAFAASQRAAQRMRTLTESLLDLARLDAEPEPTFLDSFDLAATIEECVDLIQPLGQSRRISIHLDLSPTTCPGNPIRIAQVISNLLSNAIHYNRDDGSIRVVLRPQGDHVSVAISDTGSGIHPEDLPHVFERFYRADTSRSRSDGRTGLGLAICQAIVARHQGQLTVESQPGVGSTFTLRLPATKASSSRSAVVTPAKKEDGQPGATRVT